MDALELVAVTLAWSFVAVACLITALIPIALVVCLLQVATCGVTTV